MGRRFVGRLSMNLRIRWRATEGTLSLLRQVLDELTYRTTKRARELRSRVERESRLRPPEQRADPSLGIERALKSSMLRRASTVPPAPLPPPR